MRKSVDWPALLCAISISALLACTLIFAGFVFHTEAKCLGLGYPESRVTWNLKSHCMTLDGSVTVKVDRASELNEQQR